MRETFSASEEQVRRLWSLAFGASYPAKLDIKAAFESVFLHKGGEWIKKELGEADGKRSERLV